MQRSWKVSGDGFGPRERRGSGQPMKNGLRERGGRRGSSVVGPCKDRDEVGVVS